MSTREDNSFQVSERDRKRFLKYVRKKGECQVWTGGTGSNGYGQFKYLGKIYQSHRFNWMMKHNTLLPGGISLSHTCDNPSCVNHLHLFPTSHRENMRDMLLKGRKASQKGEKNSQARLTWEDVEIIRGAWEEGYKVKDIAQKFKISTKYTRQIIRGEVWEDQTL